MSTMTLHAGLSWTAADEEDRRFRRILLQTLVVCMATGAITPYIKIPQPDNEMTDELPARRVRLLTEESWAVSRPAPPTIAAIEPREPQSAPERVVPVPPVLTPRQKATNSGVLAMRDALEELRLTTPKIGTTSQQEDGSSQIPTAAPQPSMLTANVTRGSKGIGGGVAHQSVLGATGLPDREDSRQSTPGHEGRVATRGRVSAPLPSLTRSEEEIQEVLDRNKGAMYTLYNRELRKDATLQGKLVMSITIAPAGHVTRCVILSSELGSVSLESQLVALIQRIDFGNKPDVPAVTTKVPIEFFPR